MSTRRCYEALPGLGDEALELIELGINHEQQHQELFLTDILATFAASPLEPAYLPLSSLRAEGEAIHGEVKWLRGREGVVEIGAGHDGFAFDCERPRHQVLLHPHAIADRLVTNGEWQAFIDAGGYSEPRLWLSEGWAWVQRERVTAPLYWNGDGTSFTLAGRVPLDPQAPVAHISQYEADAYARWAGARLPTEAEWEDMAGAHDPRGGNQLDRAESSAPARRSRLVRRCLVLDQLGLPAASRLPPARGHGGRI